MEIYDFSHLPDVVWVKVLKLLSFADRSRVAQTCHRLNDVFNHPSVWYSVEIILIGNLPVVRHTSRQGLLSGVVVPDRYVPMIERFGAYFQNLRLIVRGEVFHLQDPCRAVLETLAKCRLESLMMKIGEGTEPQRKLPSDVVEILTAVLKEARRLKRLDVQAWPMRSDDTGHFDLLECICANEKMNELEKLGLFWSDASKDSWVPLITCLPSPSAVVMTVHHFSSLKSLSLRSVLLSSKLLEALSRTGRATLSVLSILVIYTSSAKTGHEIVCGQIHDSVWKKFCECNPGVVVDLTFANTVPPYNFINLLSPEIPLSSVSFMKYARYKPHMLAHLAGNYNRTLAKFFDYGDELSEKTLVELVTRCSLLTVLVCHSRLSCTTVLRLAKLRGSLWKHFDVSVDAAAADDDDDDDDMVLKPADDGSFAIVAHLPGSQFYHSDDSEREQFTAIETLSRQVSDIVDFKWNPLSPEHVN